MRAQHTESAGDPALSRRSRAALLIIACVAAATWTSCRGLPSAEEASRRRGEVQPNATLAVDSTLSRALSAAPLLRLVRDDAAQLRLKLELAEVVPGPDGEPTLRRESFDAGPAYWYPASTVKSFAVVAALQELQRHATESGRAIDRDTPLAFAPLFDGETLEERDPSHLADGTITVAHLARKILLVSDNPAFNRLYDLCGRDRLNQCISDLGLDGVRIRHRLSVTHSPEQHARMPRVELRPTEGLPLVIPARTASLDLGAFSTGPSSRGSSAEDGIAIGEAYMSGGERVENPLNFDGRNEARLRDLVDLHVLLLRPDITLESGRTLELAEGDRAFVADTMRMRPRDSRDPRYDPATYADDYSKFLARGIWKSHPPETVDILDKVGRAYGFSTTNSYVEERATGRAFFLAATLYTNPNGVLNDNVYDYALADEFFAELGAALVATLWDPPVAGSR